MAATTVFVRRAWRAMLGALALVMLSAVPAPAQCPNNCTGHGTCVPSPETRRFICECFDGWTGNACSRRESKSAKAKEPEAEMIVDIAEEEPRSARPKGRLAGVRAFEQVASSHWGQLRDRERTLLEDLGWEKNSWEGKKVPRTIWPKAMQLPFEGLAQKEQAAVLGLGLTVPNWNAGKALAILMQYGV